MDLVHIIDGLIGIIVLGGGYYLTTQGKELKRVEILLNKTREDLAKDYATKSELHNETKEIKDLILRIENKLDRFIEKQNG